MKRLLSLCVLFCLCASCVAAQTIELPSVYASLEYPDDWWVFTPSSITLFAQLLHEAEMDAESMRERYETDSVVVEGYSEDFSENLRLIVTEDERSQRIFDISRASKAQERGISNSFLDRDAWRLTQIRYQDASWTNHPTMGRFLYLRYNLMEGDEIAGRGIQYFTIRNGKNYFLERTLEERRFTNKDLTAFKSSLAGLLFLETLEAPPDPIVLTLDGGMPMETGTGKLRISGTTSASAGLVWVASLPDEEPQVLSVGSANRNGEFTLEAQLETQGNYILTLIASKEGMEDTQISGSLYYQKGLLPINIENLPGDAYYSFNTFELKGSTIAGTQLQLLHDSGVVQKRVGSGGQFSFTLDTSESGSYAYTLVATHKDYQERRIDISFQRVLTDDEYLKQMMESAQSLSYRQMTGQAGGYEGTIVKVTGQVVEERAGDEVYFLRVWVTKEKKVWMDPVVVSMPSPSSLQPGQEVTFYAMLGQPYSEFDDQGNETLVPMMELLWMP